jgi:hypothetical protein
MLTQQQRTEFADTGLLKLPQAIPANEAGRMADRIREHLTSPESIQRNSEQAWLAERPHGFRSLHRAGTFNSVGRGSIPIALDELYGPDGWERPRHWGHVLVTNRVGDRPWEVPTGGWHVDRQPSVPGITVFVILAPLRPCGGGTLVLTGSHRLLSDAPVQHKYNGKYRQILAEHYPWLKDLWRRAKTDRRKRYLVEGAVLDGIPVRVVELTGEPGDAYLMRADAFHAPAPNALKSPRIMLVDTFRVEGSPIL